MSTILADAGRAALKVIGAALIALAPGLWVAPNLNGTYALGIAALMAVIAGAAAGLQVLVPALAIRYHVGGPAGALLDSFAQAFLGAFVVAITGWLAMPDLATWKSVLLGAFVGALTGGLRVVQGLLTPGERPVPATGVKGAWGSAPAEASPPARVLLPA